MPAAAAGMLSMSSMASTLLPGGRHYLVPENAEEGSLKNPGWYVPGFLYFQMLRNTFITSSSDAVLLQRFILGAAE